MAFIRWVSSPVVLDEGKLKPKIATFEDPGKPLDEEGNRPGYGHSSFINATDPFAISYVTGEDPSNLDKDVDVLDLFEYDRTSDDESLLDKSATDLGWTNAKYNQLVNQFKALGVDFEVTTKDAPLFEFVNEIGSHLGEFTAKGTWVKI